MMELSRKIIISQPIDDGMAGEIIAQILEINSVDEHYSKNIVGYSPEPIEMFINSGGGSATAGFAIIGAMEMSDTPIITYGLGIIASMALAIFVAGDIRMASRFARFMYHSVAYGADGHIQDHEDGLKEGKLIQEMYDSLFLSRTKFSREQMAEILKEKNNFFFSAKKAYKLGVVDEILPLPETKYSATDEELAELDEMLNLLNNTIEN